MGQSVRQAARKRAMEAQAQRRQERAQRDKRRSKLGVDVIVALEERDAAVSRHERKAGQLIEGLIDDGVAPSQVPEWIPGLPAAEAKRLRQVASDAEKADPT